MFDYFATSMAPVCQPTPEFTAYTAIHNRVPLDEMNPELKALKGTARKFARW